MSYWAFEWMDEHRVTNVEGARLLLANAVAVQRLQDKACASIDASEAPVEGDTCIVAGRGIDLSGMLDCGHPDCRKRQVQELFGNVWHYFNRIVVQDCLTHPIACHWDEIPPEERQKWLLGHLELLIYVRDIGADSLLEFRQKPAATDYRVKERARATGIDRILHAEDDLAEGLLKDGQIQLERRDKQKISFHMNHPAFNHTVWETIPSSKIRGKRGQDLRATLAKFIVHEHFVHLLSDVAAARQYGLSLGTGIKFHEQLLAAAHPPTVAEVAFHLRLPVLKGVPAQTLISIRRDEQEHFARFQSRLRLAIQERVRSATSERAPTIAAEIERDLIEPELDKIRDRLSAAKRALNRKTAAGFFLGVVATTCGLLAGLPPALATAAGIGTTTTVVGSATTQYLDECREISLRDMYFGWKAAERAHGAGVKR